MRRGDIQVADYHANLIYNDGAASSADFLTVVADLKRRVRERWEIALEEEVQYIGFPPESATI
jgi:UDP-N-acetylenolpyruvoylglucosamine reductase